MKQAEAKAIVEAVNELCASCEETMDAMKEVAREIDSAKYLWRQSNQSRLIKLGVAMIVFPEPVISDILGSACIALGVIQTKMRRSTLCVEDVYKTFPNIVKELRGIRSGMVE